MPDRLQADYGDCPAKLYLSAAVVRVPVVREAILDPVPASLPADYHGSTSVSATLNRRTSQLGLAIFLPRKHMPCDELVAVLSH